MTINVARCGGRGCGGCGHCDPHEFLDLDAPRRPWLADSGYEFDSEDQSWTQVIRRHRHVCRRAHRDGKVKVGDLYLVTTTRLVDDETGGGWLSHRKEILRRAS